MPPRPEVEGSAMPFFMVGARAGGGKNTLLLTMAGLFEGDPPAVLRAASRSVSTLLPPKLAFDIDLCASRQDRKK
jgi:hypothetical protein